MPRSAREARASTAFSQRHGCCFRPGMQQPRRFFRKGFCLFRCKPLSLSSKSYTQYI